MTSIAPLIYSWTVGGRSHEFTLTHAKGTGDVPYLFGDVSQTLSVSIADFFVGVVPVTQAFWHHIMEADSPALHRGDTLPVENVSWDALMAPGGFVQRVNESAAAASFRGQANAPLVFRLPTETEWEYAARGGPHWRDGYRYSGSNDIDAVAWYERRHGDHTQPVAAKAPNQLGIYDMSGNVWEWCEDTYSPELARVPVDSTAYRGPGDERVLRGGCFHNWAMHCTVSKRYEIGSRFHDGCIGFRLVMASAASLP